MRTAESKKAITVGIFIVVGLLIFIVGVFTLGSQRKAFVKSVQISAIFDDVEGLKLGNNVWFSGVKIGTIKKIMFYGNSQVEVVLSIEEEAQRYIHKDAFAKISSDGLIGNKIIVIEGGTLQSPMVENGDKLTVKKITSTDEIMQTLQVNNKNLLGITGDLKILTSQLVDGKGTVGSLLNDSLLAGNFKSIITNLNTTTGNTAKMAAELSKFSHTLNTKDGLANQLLTDTVLFKNLQATVNELQKASTAAAGITGNLNEASNKLNENNNAFGMLLNDHEVAEQLKNTLGNLESGSHKLDENLEALQHNFLLRGFFKKKAREEARLEKAKKDSL
jgi:phospholipid/cholesterol/gamma-HCH transport system substrate-binding protein